jgi:rubrerythrin
MSDSEIFRFLENQIKLENQIVKSVSDALETVENEAVSTALRGISLDSSKHAEMYRSAIALLSRSSVPLDETQLNIQAKVIERHIRLEEAVIEQLDKMMPKVKNEKVTLLLKAILMDEHRHHKLLKTLLQVVVSGEAITEADWWDALWGDVPGLWA